MFVALIKIITPTPGPNTSDRLLELIYHRVTGITLRELCQFLNRPASMIQICLQKLISSGQVRVHKSRTGTSLIYYPSYSLAEKITSLEDQDKILVHRQNQKDLAHC